MVELARVNTGETLADLLVYAPGQLIQGQIRIRSKGRMQYHDDLPRWLSQQPEQVPVETVIAHKGRQCVRAPFSPITDGHWLYGRVAVPGGAHQQSVHGQHGYAGTGGSLGVDHHRFASLQALGDAGLDGSGLTAATFDEQRAGLAGQPADHRPLSYLRF